MKEIKGIPFLFLSSILLYTNVVAQQSPERQNLLYANLVGKFYDLSHKPVFWCGTDEQSMEMRMALKQLADSCQYLGLDKTRYHYGDISNVDKLPTDSAECAKLDRLYTDAAIAFFKDVYQGSQAATYVSYDELSAKTSQEENEFLLSAIAGFTTGRQLEEFAMSLEPTVPLYLLLKAELRNQILFQHGNNIAQLHAALNIQRWVHHFNYKQFIVVNVAPAVLSYYEGDSLLLQMKVVAGKPSTPTPRFAAYCNQVIFYPYWHVPRSIALNELLPLFKMNPKMVNALNFQLLGNKGQVINPASINWKALNRNNFNYTIRQSTGCDNALGVIKFNLTDPYSVYLHDTNAKSAFNSAKRFFSHGCIRVEKPVALANYLLNNTVDTTFLNACVKGQKPIETPLPEKVPVFVVYMITDAGTDGTVKYYPDSYRMFTGISARK